MPSSTAALCRSKYAVMNARSWMRSPKSLQTVFRKKGSIGEPRIRADIASEKIVDCVESNHFSLSRFVRITFAFGYAAASSRQ